MPSGVLIARQPGTQHAFEPLRQHLQKLGFEIQAFYLNANSNLENWTPLKDFNDFSKLSLKPDFLITGTSLQSAEDSLFWKWAADQKVMSFAFVDQWVNIGKRFENITEAPDHILIPEENIKTEFQKLYLRSQIHITGTPLWDDLGNYKNLVGSKRIKNFVVFATEPMADSEAFQKHRAEHGFDDMDSLELCIKALQQKSAGPWKLNIKLHPIDSIFRVEKRISELSAHLRGIQISWDKLSKKDVFERATYLCGMRTMLLVEGSFLGMPVLSFQPNRKTTSLATDRPGIALVTKLEEASKAFEQAEKNKEHLPLKKSTELISSLLKKLL